MDKQLQFIHSCKRMGVSEKDLGYLICVYFDISEEEKSEEQSEEQFFRDITAVLNAELFCNNKMITNILNYKK